jgi:4-oxalmesaconate hydratase
MRGDAMIIDCHGHYTTAPDELWKYRDAQLADLANLSRGDVSETIKDDQLRESVEGAQIRLQRERGTDLTIFSPRASAMAHHLGNEKANVYWAEHCNNLIYRVCQLYPQNFAPVGMLPQFPGVSPRNCIAEMERLVNEMGFVGINLNPDPTGGYWSDPPLFDPWWYPVYEKMAELSIPAMVHVSQTRNPAFHTTGSHYINADTTAFMQFLTADLFKDFPKLRFIIPHGGGAVPYHWGRYRGLAQDMKRPPLTDLIRDNIFFDTCVYHMPGIELLLKIVPLDNVLFGSEMVGAVRGIDPETGHYYDDTKRYLDQAAWLSAEDKRKIFEGNVRKVYPRISRRFPA